MRGMQPTRRALLAGAGGAALLAASGLRVHAEGDTLVIGQTGDIMSLDPAFRLDTLTGIVQKHMYDSVLSRLPDMSVGPGAASAAERVGRPPGGCICARAAASATANPWTRRRCGSPSRG